MNASIASLLLSSAVVGVSVIGVSLDYEFRRVEVLSDRTAVSTTPALRSFAVCQVIVSERELGTGPERAERIFEVKTLARPHPLNDGR
jgi:hypothetical protein